MNRKSHLPIRAIGRKQVIQTRFWKLQCAIFFPPVATIFATSSAGVTASPSRKMLEAIAGGRGPRSLVGLVGYAGWAPWQLENEIRSGAWLPTDADAEIVFDVPRSEIWHRAYERVGTTPMAFTTRTVGSA